MNWLLYIAGWALGWSFVNGLIECKIKGKYDNEGFYFKIVMWTMLWIWFC